MMIKPEPLRTLALLAPLLATPALSQTPANVVATIGMIGDVAQTIGTQCVAVTTLMGPGIDPHLFRPTARDIQTLSAADLILYAGLGLEGQLGDVLEQIGSRTPTLSVGETAIAPDDLIATDDLYGVDPHVWMDASLWARIVPVIASDLSALVPDCATAIETNATHYASQLEALHAWAIETIASIPELTRMLVTAHDAFAYYGQAYGIEVEGIQGISTAAEASIADIRETAQSLVDRSIPAIFVESTINPRTIEAVIEAAAQQGHDVAIGGELFADAMGEAGTAQGTYIGMIFFNTLAIAEALGGTPAPLPEALTDWAQKWNIAL